MSKVGRGGKKVGRMRTLCWSPSGLRQSPFRFFFYFLRREMAEDGVKIKRNDGGRRYVVGGLRTEDGGRRMQAGGCRRSRD